MSAATYQSPVEEVLVATPAPLRVLAAELKAMVGRLHPDAYVTAWPRQKIISFGYGPKWSSPDFVDSPRRGMLASQGSPRCQNGNGTPRNSRLKPCVCC